MRAVLRVLHYIAFVSLSGAFAPVAFPSQRVSSRSWNGYVGVRAVPNQTGDDAAKKALDQAAQLRQEVADLERELAKGL